MANVERSKFRYDYTSGFNVRSNDIYVELLNEEIVRLLCNYFFLILIFPCSTFMKR